MKMIAGICFGLLLFSSTSFAFKPTHSKVDATAKKLADNKVDLQFKVSPVGAIVINLEGPWQLKLKSHPGLEFAKTTLGRSDLNEKETSFKLTSTKAPTAAKGQVSYQLISFICTKNKEQCYREVHDGTLDW